MDWIPSLGVKFSIGMDGISLVLVLLTTLLGFISVWCSFTAIQERHKEYYIWILVMQFSMMGVFITQDMFLFYLFWELMLVPMYFLIAIWGGPSRHQAVPVHPVRFGADAGGDPGHLLPAVQDHRPLRHVHRLVPGHGRHRRPAEPLVPDPAGPGLLRRVRHQGAHVPVPHLAA
jgi:hypothetical protein